MKWNFLHLADFVKHLINRKQIVAAVRFSCAYNLDDKDHLVDMLREHVQNVKLICESSCMKTNSIEIKVLLFYYWNSILSNIPFHFDTYPGILVINKLLCVLELRIRPEIKKLLVSGLFYNAFQTTTLNLRGCFIRRLTIAFLS